MNKELKERQAAQIKEMIEDLTKTQREEIDAIRKKWGWDKL